MLALLLAGSMPGPGVADPYDGPPLPPPPPPEPEPGVVVVDLEGLQPGPELEVKAVELREAIAALQPGERVKVTNLHPDARTWLEDHDVIRRPRPVGLPPGPIAERDLEDIRKVLPPPAPTVDVHVADLGPVMATLPDGTNIPVHVDPVTGRTEIRLDELPSDQRRAVERLIKPGQPVGLSIGSSVGGKTTASLPRRLTEIAPGIHVAQGTVSDPAIREARQRQKVRNRERKRAARDAQRAKRARRKKGRR